MSEHVEWLSLLASYDWVPKGWRRDLRALAANLERLERENDDLRFRNRIGGEMQERCQELAAENADLRARLATAEGILNRLHIEARAHHDPLSSEGRTIDEYTVPVSLIQAVDEYAATSNCQQRSG